MWRAGDGIYRNFDGKLCDVTVKPGGRISISGSAAKLVLCPEVSRCMCSRPFQYQDRSGESDLQDNTTHEGNLNEGSEDVL